MDRTHPGTRNCVCISFLKFLYVKDRQMGSELQRPGRWLATFLPKCQSSCTITGEYGAPEGAPIPRLHFGLKPKLLLQSSLPKSPSPSRERQACWGTKPQTDIAPWTAEGVQGQDSDNLPLSQNLLSLSQCPKESSPLLWVAVTTDAHHTAHHSLSLTEENQFCSVHIPESYNNQNTSFRDRQIDYNYLSKT